MKIFLSPAAGLTLIIGVILAIGFYLGRAETGRIRQSLSDARIHVERKVYAPADLEGLPVPVKRFFQKVLTEGQIPIAAVHLTQSGLFHMGEQADDWKTFTADQFIVTASPGFDWEARITMAPGFSVRVHDAYLKGEGYLHASLLGMVTLAEMGGYDRRPANGETAFYL